MLVEYADVHVCVIPGNHDRESMMHIGDALEMFYENNENVTVDNGKLYDEVLCIWSMSYSK